MKRISIAVGMLMLFSKTTDASGLLFNLTTAGTPATVNVILCLNGIGPLSCQNYSVSSLNLTIKTTIPNHTYPIAGIKINTPGYKLTGCTPYKNGYCLFSTSNTSPTNIVISNGSYELVTVGNPGNPSDMITGFGAVNYVYKIGKYDVTIKQYTDFLNAVAKSDTYSLYNFNMTTNLNSAGIQRSGSPGNYIYSVMNNGGIQRESSDYICHLV